jgi:cytochrome c oxidase assembly protein subunit 11
MSSANGRTAIKLVAIGIVMAGMAFASVPLYDWFCRTTGFGGTPLTAESNTVIPIDRVIEVRFDANVDRDFEWTFAPEQHSINLRLGEDAMAFYNVHNPTDKTQAGTATFNVLPLSAGEYFVKTECFCFQHQQLEPGETQSMPVTFYIDPEILDDKEIDYLDTITLSYTFYEKEVE